MGPGIEHALCYWWWFTCFATNSGTRRRLHFKLPHRPHLSLGVEKAVAWLHEDEGQGDGPTVEASMCPQLLNADAMSVQ